MTEEKIARINELAKLAKSRELSPSELAERDSLRKEYVASVRASLTGHLEDTYFQNQEGSVEKLKKKEPPKD